VGDRDDGARILVQVALEPRHALGIEVVGRLVEQQHVGLFEQQPAQRDAAPLTARELGDVCIAGRGPQCLHRDLERGVEVPPVARLDDVLELALLLEQLVHLLVRGHLAELHRDFFEARERLLHLGNGLFDVALDVLGFVELRLLTEVADAHALGGPRLADELLVDAGHDPQQGRLAGAVAAEHADLGAGEELQVDALEHLFAAGPDLAQVLHGEDVLVRRHRGTVSVWGGGR